LKPGVLISPGKPLEGLDATNAMNAARSRGGRLLAFAGHAGVHARVPEPKDRVSMRCTNEGPGAAGPGPAILEHMRVGVIFADDQGLVRYANKVACALLDTSCEELIERSVLCLRPACLRDVIEGAIRTFRDNPHAPPITFHSSLCAQGILLHCAAVCGVDDAYEGIVLNLTDITDHLRSLERHFESKQAEAIRTLTGGIAHGFNNLMAVVLGLASHLKARWAPEDPDRLNLTAIENFSRWWGPVRFSSRSTARPTSLPWRKHRSSRCCLVR